MAGQKQVQFPQPAIYKYLNNKTSTYSRDFTTHLNHLDMCTRRHVCYIYTKCGHAYAMPEQIIECDRTNCIFSPAHPPHCAGASCKKSCWQYRQPTEQYSPQLPEFCPTCIQNGRR